jgi:phage shock protein A
MKSRAKRPVRARRKPGHEPRPKGLRRDLEQLRDAIDRLTERLADLQRQIDDLRQKMRS